MATDYLYATTTEQVASWLARVAGRDVVAVDTETTGRDPHRDRLVLVQVAAGADLPVLVLDARAVDVTCLSGLLGDPSVVTAFHHAPFDLAFLARSGVTVDRVVDTLLAQRLLDGSDGPWASRSLAALASFRLGMHLDKSVRTSFGDGDDLADLLARPMTGAQLSYAADDALATLGIWLQQAEELRGRGLAALAAEQFALTAETTDMGLRGMRVDPVAWKAATSAAATELPEREADVQAALVTEDRPRDLFGPVPVDLGDHDDVREALQAVGLPLIGTRDAELERHRGHPAVDALLAWRGARRLAEIWGPDLADEMTDPDTGRWHPTWRLRGPDRSLGADPDVVRIARDPRAAAAIVAAEGSALVVIAPAEGTPRSVQRTLRVLGPRLRRRRSGPTVSGVVAVSDAEILAEVAPTDLGRVLSELRRAPQGWAVGVGRDLVAARQDAGL